MSKARCDFKGRGACGTPSKFPHRLDFHRRVWANNGNKSSIGGLMKKTLRIILGLLLLSLPITALRADGPSGTVYPFTMKDIDGKTVPLAKYKGKVLLIVNVASKCGFTPQYAGLEKLYEKYKGKGFVILGFPCNQLKSQEPGTDAEIKTFCSTK